jgi:hypothetical protein
MSDETWWSTDRIYAELDVHAVTGEEHWLYFTSPDGVGRIFFDTVEEAHEQTGLTSVVHLI